MLNAAINTISSNTRKYTVFSRRNAAKRLGQSRDQSSTRYVDPTAFWMFAATAPAFATSVTEISMVVATSFTPKKLCASTRFMNTRPLSYSRMPESKMPVTAKPPDPRNDAHGGGASDGRNRLQRIPLAHAELICEPISEDNPRQAQIAPVHSRRRPRLKIVKASLRQVFPQVHMRACRIYTAHDGARHPISRRQDDLSGKGRSGRGHVFPALQAGRELIVPGQVARGFHQQDVRVQPEEAVTQHLLESGHHRNHHVEGDHGDHDAQDGDQGEQGDEAFATSGPGDSAVLRTTRIALSRNAGAETG